MVFYGQQILKAQTQMRAAFSDINKDCRATLYVGISRFRANAFFPLIWKLYHPSHPNISSFPLSPRAPATVFGRTWISSLPGSLSPGFF